MISLLLIVTRLKVDLVFYYLLIVILSFLLTIFLVYLSESLL